MRADIEFVLKEFNVVTFGNKKSLEALSHELRQDEVVKYIAFSNVDITNKDCGEKTSFPATMFISDERIVFRPSVIGQHQVIEYPLSALQAVQSKGNGLTGGHIFLSTDTDNIKFLVSYKKKTIDKIEGMLSEIIEASLAQRRALKSPSEQFGSVSVDSYGIVKCGSCGAQCIVCRRSITICDYCRSPIALAE